MQRFRHHAQRADRRRLGAEKDQYQLRASLPKDVPAEVILPPEAKAVWQSAPSTNPWQETVTISGNATIVVKPGKVEIR